MHIQRPAHALLMAAALISAPAALAQGIYAETWDQANARWNALAGFPSRALGQVGLPSGSDLTIEIQNSATLRVYADNPATTDIGVVTLRTQPGQSPTLLIGKNDLPQPSASTPLTQMACRTLAGVNANELTRTQIHAQNISGPGVEVHRLIRLDLTGDLDAPIIHWGDKSDPAPSAGPIDIEGSITPKGSIAAYEGSIGAVTIAGDLNGHITARQGTIASIDVAGDMGSDGRPAIWASAPFGSFAIDHITIAGNIGRPGQLADITTAGSIRMIEADEIHANIDLEADPAVPGFIAGLTTRTGGYEGLLRARTLTSFGGWDIAPCFVSIAGDLEGEFIFTNAIRNERSAGPEIDIAGTVTETSSIIIGSMPVTNTGMPAGEIFVRAEQGLAGQIIVGKGQTTDFPANAIIRVGIASPSIVTSASKFYDIPFANFGGGSVGIAPFNFHTTESWPHHNATVTLAQNELLVAVAPRFFGPVMTDTSAQMIVEHLAPSSQTWTDRSADFAVEAATSTDGDRTIVVSALGSASFTAGQWRMRPVDGTLLSARAIGTPEVRFVSEYDDNTYRFNVDGGSNCPPPPGLVKTNDNPISFENSDGIVRANCP